MCCVLFLSLCKILLCLEKCLRFSLGTVCLKDTAWTLSPIPTTLTCLYDLLQKLFPSRFPFLFRGERGPVLADVFPCFLWSWFLLLWLLPSRVSTSAGDFCHAQTPGLRPPTRFPRWAAAMRGSNCRLLPGLASLTPRIYSWKACSEMLRPERFIPCQTVPTWLSSTALAYSLVLTKLNPTFPTR